MMTIGDRIKQLRRKNSLTQDDLAEKLSTTKQTIHKYENNIITNIPADKIEWAGTTQHILSPLTMTMKNGAMRSWQK